MPNNGDLLPARLVLSRDGCACAHRGGPLGVAEVTASEARPWPAPAKLNLFLHILGRRADGYHELQTCFQFVDLCDDISIRVRSDGRILRSAGAAGVASGGRISACARRRRSKPAAGCALGADISVIKRIPMGAGLGGGSSDAATCLVALNRLWGLALAHRETGGARA